MKKIIKPIAWVLLAALVVIQFFKPERNLSSIKGPAANDISKLYPVPQEVASILKTSCYDCHSNNTHYPWYSNFQPVAWWLDDHIKEGKKEINFSTLIYWKHNTIGIIICNFVAFEYIFNRIFYKFRIILYSCLLISTSTVVNYILTSRCVIEFC